MIRKKTQAPATEQTSSDSNELPTSGDLIAAIDGANEKTYEEVLRKLGVPPGEALSPGDTLTLTVGQELFGPIPYNNFTVGPFSATTRIREGETAADASIRAYGFLMQLFVADFAVKKKQFFDRVGESGEKD